MNGGAGVYTCCNDVRRELVRGHKTLNGIDYLEVLDHEAPSDAERQRILRLHFLNPAPALARDNIVIEGGERIRGVKVDQDPAVDPDPALEGRVVEIHVSVRGDYSPYRLRVVNAGTLDPHVDLDPLLATVEFSFKVECASDFDCRVVERCPAETRPAPHIDYLARDYASFRRLMLDRLALLLPDWRAGTPADLGVTLVELLAYVADHLSYRQDAVATEAYLGTARRRASVRRHARLVDYNMHDGCNARAFVQFEAKAALTLPGGTRVLTRTHEGVRRFDPAGREYGESLARGAVVFETMHPVPLDPLRHELDFYTWKSTECCLPRGATRATLAGRPPLEPGQLLLLRERVGPETGNPADADPLHRHVVRLIRVTPGEDRLRDDPNVPILVTEIEWDAADALPFPLCISTSIDGEDVPRVSVANGNIALADHGLTIEESLGVVPAPSLFRPAEDDGDACTRPQPVAVIPRFRPTLRFGPLTQQGRAVAATADNPSPGAFDPTASATAAMRWSLQDVLADITVFSELDATPTEEWDVRHDLLESDPAARHFVAEVENDGIATIRFGDDEYGRRPAAGSIVTTRYRVGNGPAGNVGPEAIGHVVSADPDVLGVKNWTPGRGGIAPEAMEHVRQSAPAAFRLQERAVTEIDYAEVTERHPEVDRAKAMFRFTGSWYTLFDSIDRRGGLPVDDAFRTGIRRHVERYRVVGNDVAVVEPLFVSLEVALTICVARGYFRSDIEAALRDIFTGGIRRDGSRGFFHPDHFTFGEPVALSRIVAAAAAVDGVDAVFVTRFRRQGSPATDAQASGILRLGTLEIARLANDRNFPDHGALTLTMRGGA